MLKSNGQDWSVRYFCGNETALKAHLLFLVGYSKDHLIVEVYNPQKESLSSYSTTHLTMKEFFKKDDLGLREFKDVEFPKELWNQFVAESTLESKLKNIYCEPNV